MIELLALALMRAQIAAALGVVVVLLGPVAFAAVWSAASTSTRSRRMRSTARAGIEPVTRDHLAA